MEIIMGDPQFGDDYEYENSCGNIHIYSWSLLSTQSAHLNTMHALNCLVSEPYIWGTFMVECGVLQVANKWERRGVKVMAWDVKLFSLLRKYWHCIGMCSLYLWVQKDWISQPWRWKQYAPPKYQYAITTLLDIISKKLTIMLTTIRSFILRMGFAFIKLLETASLINIGQVLNSNFLWYMSCLCLMNRRQNLCNFVL